MATAKAAALPPSALDLATAAEKSQAALLEDAKSQLDRAASTRELVEADVAAAEKVYAAALQASAAKRGDDALADVANRADVRLAHARADLARAVDAHSKATADLAEREGHLENAGRARELVQVQTRIVERMRSPLVTESVEAIVAGAVALRERVMTLRRLRAEDAADVERIKALGGAAQPADDTPFAGVLAKALLDNGGLFHVPNVHEIRWAFEGGPLSGDPDGTATAIRIARFVLESVAYGEKHRATHGPIASSGRRHLELAAAWSTCRTKDEGEVARVALQREEGEAIALANRQAHEARLVAAEKAAAQAKKPPTSMGGPVTSGPYQRGATKGPEGEFMVGDPDDFSGGKRPLTVG
jgi:hypothetical protein